MAKYLLVFSEFASVVLIISNALAFEMNPSRMSMSMKERSDLFAEKVGLIAKETHYLFSKKDIEHLFSSSSRYNHMVYCDNNENCAFEIWDLHSITGKQATAVVFIAGSGNGARSSLLEDIVSCSIPIEGLFPLFCQEIDLGDFCIFKKTSIRDNAQNPGIVRVAYYAIANVGFKIVSQDGITSALDIARKLDCQLKAVIQSNQDEK